MAAQMTPRFRDLPDVDWSSFADGEVPTYATATDSLTGETPAAGGSTGAAGGVLGGTYPNPGFAVDMVTQAELDSHSDDPSFVHGITNTADLATDAEVAAAVSAHDADTSVHGIADTTALATDIEVAAAVSAHGLDTTVHGVDTANVPSSGQKAALAGTTGTPGAGNKFVTETDPAIGGADLSSTVITAPATSGRNVIQPSTDAVALTLKGATGQTEVLQQWETDTDPVAYLYPDGGFQVGDYVTGAVLLAPTGEITAVASDVSDALFSAGLVTDGTARFRVVGGGTVEWANGTGSADTTMSRVDVNVLAAPFLEFSEGSAPPTPAANKVRQFVRDNAGTTQVCHLYPSGNIVVVSEDF